jgi:hypothetical protein
MPNRPEVDTDLRVQVFSRDAVGWAVRSCVNRLILHPRGCISIEKRGIVGPTIRDKQRRFFSQIQSSVLLHPYPL